MTKDFDLKMGKDLGIQMHFRLMTVKVMMTGYKMAKYSSLATMRNWVKAMHLGKVKGRQKMKG